MSDDLRDYEDYMRKDGDAGGLPCPLCGAPTDADVPDVQTALALLAAVRRLGRAQRFQAWKIVLGAGYEVNGERGDDLVETLLKAGEK